MSTVTLQLVETDSKFLEAAGQATEYNNEMWYHLPFWFRKVGENLFVEYRFEDLPEGFKKHLQSFRQPITNPQT